MGDFRWWEDFDSRWISIVDNKDFNSFSSSISSSIALISILIKNFFLFLFLNISE